MTKDYRDLEEKIRKIVESVIEITEEQKNRRRRRFAYIYRQLPIASLDNVRAALKKGLGKDYRKVKVFYRGPRPRGPKLPNTPENLLKIIRLGKDAYRTERQRAANCLKAFATHYAIYAFGI